MKAVRPGLQHDVCNGSSRASQLGIIVAGGHVDGLKRFNRRDQRREETGAVIVVDALDLDVVSVAGLPVDPGRQRVLRIEELRVLAGHGTCARDQIHQDLEVAVPAERQLLHLSYLNFPADIRSVRLKQGSRFRAHGDRLRDRAGPKLQVNAPRRVYQDIDLVYDGGFKARKFCFHAIHARVQVSKDVVAALVRHGRTSEVGVDFGYDDLRAGDQGARAVGNRTDKTRLHRLSVERGGREQLSNEHQECQTRTQSSSACGLTVVFHV